MIIILTVIIKTTNTQLVLHNFITVITLTIAIITINTTNFTPTNLNGLMEACLWGFYDNG